MAATAVTITGQATMPGGAACAGAIVTFAVDEKAVNTGTTIVGKDAVADANGNWTIVVSATDDGGTAPAGMKYQINVVDPVSGEMLDDFRAPVANANTPTTITALRALAS